jgi:hypothetical protein
LSLTAFYFPAKNGVPGPSFTVTYKAGEKKKVTNGKKTPFFIKKMGQKMRSGNIIFKYNN